MAQRSLVRAHSSRFLKTLLTNPELPAFVARLEAPTLNRLIEHVGLEDAGPLIAYTTDRQLRSLLDESLWSSLAPGRPETHRPEEFIRWLYVLQDQGEAFLADRLVGLGLDYLVLNFAQLVTINGEQSILSENYEVLEQYAGPAAYAEEFDGFYVTAVYDEEWDVTRAALVALQSEHPEALAHVLYRMSRDAAANLMHDISGDRRDAKENAGYVTPESATAFLELTRQTSLASLVTGENHDPVSARYFAELRPFAPDEPEQDADEPAGQADAPAHRSRDADKQRELEALLIEAEIVTDTRSTLLLAAPDRDVVLPVKHALDGLQHVDAGLFSERLSELVYLSNVLIAGTTLNGERFDEGEAAHAVLATCNLGLSYLGEEADATASVREGLVRLFRIGWRVQLQVPAHVADRLVATLRSANLTQKLFDRRWILAEVDATLDELVAQVNEARFDDVETHLAFIALVIEQDTCDALQRLISDHPRYPLDGRTRYIESMDDLADIDDFMGSLADYAKS